MEFRYSDYHDHANGPSQFWPQWQIIPGGACIATLQPAIEFLWRLNGLIAELGGFYSGKRNAKITALGVLPGFTHLRFFDARDGKQYNAVHTNSNYVDGHLIAEHAFRSFNYNVRDVGRIGVIDVSEGAALHLAVDGSIQSRSFHCMGRIEAEQKPYNARIIDAYDTVSNVIRIRPTAAC